MKKKESGPTTMEEPPDEFVKWWEPFGKDQESGAEVGGHPEAVRIWARKDPGRWVHRTYGTSTKVAWNTDLYRQEYLVWVQVGRPEQIPPFIGIAAPIEKQKEFWQGLKPILSGISRPVPELEPDYAEVNPT